MARSCSKTLGPLAMRSICAGDVEGPRYSRTSIMRAETGHGCGLQMILKHNFNQVCSADCLTHHADPRRLGATGSRHAFRRWSVVVRTRNLRHTMCFSLRRLRLLDIPTSGSPIRCRERRQCRSTGRAEATCTAHHKKSKTRFPFRANGRVVAIRK